MEFLIVCLAALFFPVQAAVAMTAAEYSRRRLMQSGPVNFR